MRYTARFAGKRIGAALAAAAAVLLAQPTEPRAAEPLTIGFDMSLTGGIAANGKAALLAMQIWQAQVNAKGGLLGREVKFVYYDDQSNPAQVPGIITKLLDVDKVDFLLGGSGTNMVAPAMPLVIQRHLINLSLFALDVNSEFHYDRYFSMIPAGGPHPKESFTEGFFRVAETLATKPKTIAIAGADAEFSKNAMDGARALIKEAGYQIVYDHAYPPATIDYTPIARAIGAANADLVLVCSYPPDTVGMVRAVREIGLKAQLFGGGMVGTQTTTFKTQLGPLMNGIVNYDFWLPWTHFASPEAKTFLAQYQEKSPAEQIDLLGYYLPPFAYARMEVLQQAIEATQSLDQDKLADYLRSHTFKTVAGDIAFGPNGEWAEARTLEVQFQGVEGSGLDQFKTPATEPILWPPAEKTGTLRLPYSEAQY
ncbi:MAG: amino acid ABC transporter substrate-binding protein [Alphaproteobacteria bacterium]|nr:amino acid ABC transporter substrate-binding protein [Alphaproteobacteria bacterium]